MGLANPPPDPPWMVESAIQTQVSRPPEEDATSPGPPLPGGVPIQKEGPPAAKGPLPPTIVDDTTWTRAPDFAASPAVPSGPGTEFCPKLPCRPVRSQPNRWTSAPSTRRPGPGGPSPPEPDGEAPGTRMTSERTARVVEPEISIR